MYIYISMKLKQWTTASRQVKFGMETNTNNLLICIIQSFHVTINKHASALKYLYYVWQFLGTGEINTDRNR
jgi:hypothetical protein